MIEPKRRGRPPGSKNKTSAPGRGDVASAAGALPETCSSSSAAVGSTRETLEADRDRLLKGIRECSLEAPDGSAVTDWKTIAALQSQLNGVNRMLLRITGETAPTDANLIRSPQWLRLRGEIIAALKKHPAALADVAAVFDTAER